MRLWHYKLLPYLPRQQLLGQHRECCALRGNGWGKKHATVNYVFNYPPVCLYIYHVKVMREMQRRGYSASPEWFQERFRGKHCECWNEENFYKRTNLDITVVDFSFEYPEHNKAYLKECLLNLNGKGIHLEREL